MGSGASKKATKNRDRYESDGDEEEVPEEEEEEEEEKDKPDEDDDEKKGARHIAPREEVLLVDLSSKITLSLRGEKLRDGKNLIVVMLEIIFVLYTKLQGDDHWAELGTTEIQGLDCAWPSWERTFDAEFKVEHIRWIRCEVYKIRKQNMMDDLLEQKYIGGCEFILTESIMARARADDKSGHMGWLYKRLENFHRKRGQKPPGTLCIFAEESLIAKQKLYFRSRMTGISSTDFWKSRADPYWIINRTEVKDDDDGLHELQLTPCYRSEVARKTRDPAYKQATVTAAQLCGNDLSKDIIITVLDWNRLSSDNAVGEVVTNYEELQKASARGRPHVMPIMRREGPRLLGMTKMPYAAIKKRTKSKLSRNASKGDRSHSPPSSRSGTSLGSKAHRQETGSSSSRGASGSPTVSKDVSGRGGRTSSHLSSGSDSRDRSSTKGSGMSAGSSMSGSLKSAISSLTQGSTPGQFGPVMGNLIFEEFGLIRKWSFLDYVRGGLELRLMMGIDFTRSNVGQQNRHSLHSLAVEPEDTAYAACIRALGDVLRSYDNDDKYPVYGFGARIPPSHTVCSDCFALTGDFFKPEVKGIDGVLKAYMRALHICHLHGPSCCGEVIRLCANMAAPYKEDPDKYADPTKKPGPMKYFVMLILTDGDIEDQERVMKELRALKDLPVSLVFIGIGHTSQKEFTFLEQLMRDIKPFMAARALQEAAQAGRPKPKSVRDLVHFVKFNDYRDNLDELAAATLAALPHDVVEYYDMMEIKPRGLEKFEDPSGVPLPKPEPREAVNERVAAERRAELIRTGAATAAPTQSGKDMQRSRTGSSTSRSPVGSKDRATGRSKSSLGSGASGSRTGSKDSHISSETDASSRLALNTRYDDDDDEDEEEFDEYADEQEEEEEQEAPLPIFLELERDRITEDAIALGYDRFQIARVLRDGIPAGTLDVLVDNIMNGGYGKMPCYREAALAAIPDETRSSSALPGMKLPGQPASPSSPAHSLFPTTRMQDYGTELLALSQMPTNEKDSRAQSRLESLGLLGRTRSRLSGAGSERSSSSLLSSRTPPGPAAIGDGTAALSLLEEATIRSRRASKEDGDSLSPALRYPSASPPGESHSGSAPGSRTTSKTLEEVAGRLGTLPSRTKSKGDGQPGRRVSKGEKVSFAPAIQEEDEKLDAIQDFGANPAPPVAQPPRLQGGYQSTHETPMSSKSEPSTQDPGSKSEPQSSSGSKSISSKTIPPHSAMLE